MMNTGFCRFLMFSLQLTGLIAYGAANLAVAVDERDTYTKAPPNHALLSSSVNGWYYVPKELKHLYDGTLERLEALQTEVNDGQISAKDATEELAELKLRLQAIREKIKETRVHVAGADIHEQTETIEFEIGPEKRLAITSNHVRVVGWPGPKVKVELRKMVLSSDQKPVDEQLKSISILHEHGKAEFAGPTDEQRDAQEAEFMAKNGARLSKKQLEDRRRFVDEIRQSYAYHRELLGKEIDQLTVKGLEYDQNGFVEMKVMSDGGDGRAGTVRQRYAELTVYVPECASVCVRGARRGLLVENLAASLTIVDEDSTDSDARSRFEIQGLKGNLACRNFPLQVIANVQGHVAIVSTTEFGVEGAGTSHHDDLRDMTPARPYSVSIHGVTEGVKLRFGRVRLDLQDIAGTIDIENEFGDTHFSSAAPLADSTHRIVSQSGRIDVELSQAAWKSVPVLAVTNHGGSRTNIPREEFDDFHLSGEDKHDQVRRDWSGFRKVVEGEEQFAVFRLIDRFAAILSDGERTSGLDLLTRSGRIVVLRK